MRNSGKVDEKIVPLLTVEQVAKRLNVGVRTVWRLDKEDKIPEPFMVGHRKRWEASDLELWLKSGSPSRKEFKKLKERIGDGKTSKGNVQNK
jgi:excisionase family DNA binding protein